MAYCKKSAANYTNLCCSLFIIHPLLQGLMTLYPVGATTSAANPLVSIVWFGKNRLQWVEKEVGGILRQDHANWQLVVEDAGSKDGTLEWFRRLAERDQRVVVTSTPRSSPGEALLSALRRCTGEYIAICPRHATIALDALDAAVQSLDRSPSIGAVAGSDLLVDREGEPAGAAFDLVMALFTPLRIAPHGGVIRRTALLESGLMRDDWRLGSAALDLWCRIATDHEIETSAALMADVKAAPWSGDFEPAPNQPVEDRMALVKTLFDREGFLADPQEDIALQYECMVNQLGILREELGDTPAVERWIKHLSAKVAHLLSYDGRAERSHYRWRRLWHMSAAFETFSWICKPWSPGTSELAARILLFIAVHVKILSPAVVWAALPKRSRLHDKPSVPELHSMFADVYGDLAERYNALGQISTALHHWNIAGAVPDAMRDGMPLQAEMKRPGATEASIAETHKRYVARYLPNAVPVTPRLLSWDGQRRIRVGYHCSFMDNDTIRYMMGRVFKAHDRERFHIIGYSPRAVPGELASCFDVVRDTSTREDDPRRVVFATMSMKSHAEFRHMVLSDRIDILVELTGFSPGHRFPAMASRCAPVQISFLNHTASSQVPNIDYILADEICLPASNGFARYYSEEIYRLPGCFFCFDYRGSEYPKIAEPPSLTKDYVTFGCFGFGGKLNRELLQLWADLLRQVPTARLHLQNVQITNKSRRRFLVERFRTLGVAPERLILANGVKRADLLKVYASIDIMLDTWPYCGGNATAEALWHGVPVVTLKGEDRFASRYGASLLAAAGCEDLVANSAEEYIAIAKRLAGDPAHRAHLRRRLRDMSIEHGLGDSARFVRRLEDAYVDMLSRAAA
jgi:glycosyltransferase involved in cell wall biosynthesis